jgi:hypothetical protein
MSLKAVKTMETEKWIKVTHAHLRETIALLCELSKIQDRATAIMRKLEEFANSVDSEQED